MLTTVQKSGKWPFDAANAEALDHKLEKVEKFVGQTVSGMAESLGVSPEEALGILIKVHVEMMGDLRGAVHLFGDDALLGRVGPEKLCKAIEEVIMAISKATALDTDEITEIFAKNAIANISDISYRLHLRSLIDRSYTS
ncbi:MAG: hypothetical protein WB870_13570 [Gallionellaceae bacterium]